MIQQIFFTSFAVAGAAVLWRNLINDLPKLESALSKLPWVLKKSLACGFCFTYWLSFAALLILEPTKQWQLPLRFELPEILTTPIHFGASWMLIGITASIVRFGYVVLQETVHWQVHTLNSHKHSH